MFTPIEVMRDWQSLTKRKAIPITVHAIAILFGERHPFLPMSNRAL
jgi:hypothetical protein